MPPSIDVSQLSQMARFNIATRRNFQPVQDQQLTVPGQFGRVDVPQVGLLAAVNVYLFGTITTGTGAAGTWDANYWPYNLLNLITFRSNEGLEIYRTRGYTNLLVQMMDHISNNPAQLVPPTAFNDPTTGARGILTYPTGAVAASTAYQVGVMYRIPVALDDALTGGLLLLQNQSSRAQVEIQLGQFTDWAGASGVLGAGGTIALTARIEVVFFSVPDDRSAWPDLTFIHRWIEQQTAWGASGDIPYSVPVTGVIARVIGDFQNNGVPQPFLATGSNPGTANFGNLTVQYASAQKPEIEDFRFNLARFRRMYGQNMPAGVLVWDFSRGNGSAEASFSGRDTYNTAALTEFSVIANTSVTPTNGKVFWTRQELQARALE